jgi:hypothetical protein
VRCVLIYVRVCLGFCVIVVLMIGVMSTKRIVYNGAAGAAVAAAADDDDDSAGAGGAGVGCAASVSICVVVCWSC